jgi:hypothetical protein
MTSKKYEYIEVQNGHLLPLIIHCLSKIKEHIEKIGKERDTYKHPRHTRLFFEGLPYNALKTAKYTRCC